MARKILTTIDKTVDRFGYWGGTGKLLYDNWPTIIASAVTLGGFLYAAFRNAWRYMQMIATNVSYWYFPFFAVILLFSIVGCIVSALLIKRYFAGETALGYPLNETENVTYMPENTDYSEYILKSDHDALFAELEKNKMLLNPDYKRSVIDFENDKKAKVFDDQVNEIQAALDLLQINMNGLHMFAKKPAEAEMQGTWTEPLKTASNQFHEMERVLNGYGFTCDLSKAPNYEKNHARPVPNENGITDPVKLQDFRRIYDQNENAKTVVSGVMKQLAGKAADLRNR